MKIGEMEEYEGNVFEPTICLGEAHSKGESS